MKVVECILEAILRQSTIAGCTVQITKKNEMKEFKVLRALFVEQTGRYNPEQNLHRKTC